MMQSLGGEQERSNAAPVRRVMATEGTGITDLLEAIRDVIQNRK